MPEDKLTLGEDQVHWPLVGQVLLGSVDWVRVHKLFALKDRVTLALVRAPDMQVRNRPLICLSIHQEAKLDRFFHDSQAQAITLAIIFEAVEMR